MKNDINIFWFRRDLSLHDNHGLYHALKSDKPVLGLFIFDREIIDELEENDSRLSFIHSRLKLINNRLKEHGSSLLVKHGFPKECFSETIKQYNIANVFANEDYEPYSTNRDAKIKTLLSANNSILHLYKNQVVFAKNDILKKDKTPYTIFTHYKNSWLKNFYLENTSSYPSEELLHKFTKTQYHFPELLELGFSKGPFIVKDFNLSKISNYDKERDFPSKDSGTYLGPHLRFGTISIRELVKEAYKSNNIFLSELIWREFFIQIMFHFPYVERRSFKKHFDYIAWENNLDDFEKWCKGETGYPIVDAGMRELNSTGYMHNRVRMITASFLTKHLLIDWRWGEAYFAKMLLDYELSSNNGNWQWAASTGCDSVPYFRIFNPSLQHKKFDKNNEYIKRFIPEFPENYEFSAIVNHEFARERCLERYKKCKTSNI